MTYHVEHAHMHFDDYAEMTLQPVDAPGASARSGAKQTFCIIDTDKVQHSVARCPEACRLHELQQRCSGDVCRLGRYLSVLPLRPIH
jgi:hypothetical protein